MDQSKQAQKPIKLTPKQKRFCEEYLIDLCGTKAAIRAGYSPKTANEIAAENLTKLSIKKYLAFLQNKISTKLEISTEKVIQELAKIAYSNTEDYLSFTGNNLKLKSSKTLSRDKLAAIGEVSKVETKTGVNVAFKLHNKVQALELLGRYLGCWNDKLKITADFEKALSNFEDFLNDLPEDKIDMLIDKLLKISKLNGK